MFGGLWRSLGGSPSSGLAPRSEATINAANVNAFSKSLEEIESFVHQIHPLRTACLDAALALDNLETRLTRFAAPSDVPTSTTSLPHEYIAEPERVLGLQPGSVAASPLPLDVHLDPVVKNWLNTVAPLSPKNARAPESRSFFRLPFLHNKDTKAEAVLFSTRAALVQHLVDPFDLFAALLEVSKERLAWLTQHQQQATRGASQSGQDQASPAVSAIAEPIASTEPTAVQAVGTPPTPQAAEAQALHTTNTASAAQQEALLAASVAWLVKSAPCLRALAAHVLHEMRKAATTYKLPAGLLQPLPPQYLIRPASAGGAALAGEFAAIGTAASSEVLPRPAAQVDPLATNSTQAVQPAAPASVSTYLPTNIKTHKEPLKQLMADVSAGKESPGVQSVPAESSEASGSAVASGTSGLLPPAAESAPPLAGASVLGTGARSSGSAAELDVPPPGRAAGGTESVLMGAAQLPVHDTSQLGLLAGI